MNIRLETPKDYREVENLTREAFWNVYRPGCTEHYVLNQYRTNPNFIPELDLVMIENDQIIGHVMDEDILQKKKNAVTDMGMCDVPCRLSGVNFDLQSLQKPKPLHAEFI